jgi:hypothetical protein
MLQCVHVDEIRENLWGGLPRKRCCVVINEWHHELVLKWWETSTNVSPIWKDIKRRCISAIVFDGKPILGWYH